MRCDEALARIDSEAAAGQRAADGRLAQESDLLSLHLAGCATCRAAADAEATLRAAFSQGGIRESAELSRRLLEVPGTERRLRALVPWTLPLAGLTCAAGAGLVALWLGIGGGLSVRSPGDGEAEPRSTRAASVVTATSAHEQDSARLVADARRTATAYAAAAAVGTAAAPSGPRSGLAERPATLGPRATLIALGGGMTPTTPAGAGRGEPRQPVRPTGSAGSTTEPPGVTAGPPDQPEPTPTVVTGLQPSTPPGRGPEPTPTPTPGDRAVPPGPPSATVPPGEIPPTPTPTAAAGIGTPPPPTEPPVATPTAQAGPSMTAPPPPSPSAPPQQTATQTATSSPTVTVTPTPTPTPSPTPTPTPAMSRWDSL